MKKTVRFLSLALVCLLSSCGESPSKSVPSSSSDSSSVSTSETVSLENKLEGRTIDLLYRPARNYLESKDPASVLANAKSTPGDHTNPLTLKWNIQNGKGRYALQIAKDELFNDIYRTFDSIRPSIRSLDVENLIPGKYFYRIKGENVVSDIDSFVIKGDLRTIATNNTIINMRDLGGWKIGEDSRVKYGLLYRSAAWNSADKTTESRLKALHMKTELDIRYSSSSKDYRHSEYPMSGIDYRNYGMGQYDSIVPGSPKYSSAAKANLKNTFELLAKKESYPLTFHCTAGADRTGTLAFLINGFLGVGYEDLCKDFELTSFYNSRRWRSAIKDGSFDDSGVMQDDSNNYVGFGALYNQMMKHYGTSGGTLSETIKNYLAGACEISEKTLNSLKNILVETIE